MLKKILKNISKQKEIFKKYPELKEFEMYYNIFKDSIKINKRTQGTRFESAYSTYVVNPHWYISELEITKEQEIQILYVQYCKDVIKRMIDKGNK